MRIQNNGSLLKGGKAKLSVTNAMLILIAAFSVFAASCSKNKDVQSPGLTVNNGLSVVVGSTPQAITGTGVTSGTIYNTSGLYQVDTFRQAYSTGPGQPADGNFYWLFADNEAGTSTDFDIKFTGIATGDITAPTGFGAPVLKYIDKSFTSVVADDFDDALDPESNTIGMNEVVGDNVPPEVAAFANGKGWYKYMWNNHTIQPVAGRTLLWQQGTVIFKFEIQSIYKGSLFPYYTFRYQQIAS